MSTMGYAYAFATKESSNIAVPIQMRYNITLLERQKLFGLVKTRRQRHP
ncbi:MAG: hypothetical protein V7K88_22660 [Nostoc sp.]